MEQHEFPPCVYGIGDIVEVEDRIDPEDKKHGVIKLIEQDTEWPTLYWVYIRANLEWLNDKPHPLIGSYWEVLEHTCERLTLVCKATTG